MRYFLAVACVLFACACGGGGGDTSQINPNFPSLSESPIAPATAIDPNNDVQVVTIEAGEGDQNGEIGYVEAQDPSHVFCVIIDPKEGNSADLEVCEKDKANPDADSVNGICPEADQVTRCASSNEGSVPDFCSVTGAADYAIIIKNLTSEAVHVAYQVIDVTAQPTQSCADLSITENSILTDDE